MGNHENAINLIFDKPCINYRKNATDPSPTRGKCYYTKSLYKLGLEKLACSLALAELSHELLVFVGARLQLLLRRHLLVLPLLGTRGVALGQGVRLERHGVGDGGEDRVRIVQLLRQRAHLRFGQLMRGMGYAWVRETLSTPRVPPSRSRA